HIAASEGLVDCVHRFDVAHFALHWFRACDHEAKRPRNRTAERNLFQVPVARSRVAQRPGAQPRAARPARRARWEPAAKASSTNCSTTGTPRLALPPTGTRYSSAQGAVHTASTRAEPRLTPGPGVAAVRWRPSTLTEGPVQIPCSR